MKNKTKIRASQETATETKSKDHFKGKYLLVCLFIAACTYWLFSASFDNEFVNWDDQTYVEEQPLVLNKEYSKLWKTPISLNYHPVTMVSLAYQVPKNAKQLKAAAFIKVNVYIHIVNSLLVFVFIFMLTSQNWMVAFFTSMVFAVHPMHVESVVWVSERKDVLYTLFLLLSCIFYLKYLDKSSYKWLLLAGFFFVFSVLSKAMAVIIPVIWLMMDYFKGRAMNNPKVWIEKVPFLAISVFFGLMAVDVQGGGDFGGILSLYGEKSVALADENVLSLIQRFQFATYGFVQYIFKFFYPMDICAFYPYPDSDRLTGASAILYPLAFILIAIVAMYNYNKNKVLTFGFAFYFITVALVLQFISVGLAIMADRYSYVPYIGLAFMIFYLFYEYVGKKSNQLFYGYIAIGVIFITFLAFKTKSQVDVWQNSEKLWTQVLQYFPKEDLALGNRGNHRGKTGDITGAMADFEKAISDGCERADVYEGLGNSYGTLSDQQPEKKQELVNKAISMYTKALEINPNKGNIFYNLGISQIQTNPAASVTAFNNALRLMPYKEGEILPVLGMSYLNAANYKEALAALTKAIDGGVVTDNVYYHRGLAHLGVGDRAKATTDFKKALEINPSNQDVKSKMAAFGL